MRYVMVLDLSRCIGSALRSEILRARQVLRRVAALTCDGATDARGSRGLLPGAWMTRCVGEPGKAIEPQRTQRTQRSALRDRWRSLARDDAGPGVMNEE